MLCKLFPPMISLGGRFDDIVYKIDDGAAMCDITRKVAFGYV